MVVVTQTMQLYMTENKAKFLLVCKMRPGKYFADIRSPNHYWGNIVIAMESIGTGSHWQEWARATWPEKVSF